MAVATPAMLPVPTRPAREIMSDWNEETPESDFSPLTIWRIMSGILTTCTHRVRTVKYRPAPRQRTIKGGPMMLLASQSMASLMRGEPF